MKTTLQNDANQDYCNIVIMPTLSKVNIMIFNYLVEIHEIEPIIYLMSFNDKQAMKQI